MVTLAEIVAGIAPNMPSSYPWLTTSMVVSFFHFDRGVGEAGQPLAVNADGVGHQICQEGTTPAFCSHFSGDRGGSVVHHKQDGADH